MDPNTVLIAFGLTLIAGLSTGIGGALAFFTRETNTKVLSLGLGFSAGVMIYVSFTGLLVEANSALAAEYGLVLGSWLAVLSFFVGVGVAALIDRLVPSFENPHEIHRIEEMYSPRGIGRRLGKRLGLRNGRGCKGHEEECPDAGRGRAHVGEDGPKCVKLYRLGILSAVALTIHNFPEGIATFTSYLANPVLGLSIAIAVAIHNIPEGIAVSVPIYYATCDRKKAFLYSTLSGFAEPLGALIGFLILSRFLNGMVFGVIFGAVAGIMVFVSLDQLLPAAREYGEQHLAIYGLVGGMMFMAVSLLLFL